ncbi:MAG: hypothetical protein EGR20_26480, partial [Alistipes onderdonkii]|nr:hypothetical protein [Alistipes onderdonkii]
AFGSYIDRIRRGENNVTWPTDIRWFAKSSGTTASKSKFIPVSREGLRNCHLRGPMDIVCMVADRYPESRVFSGKTLTLGGSHRLENTGGTAQEGDLSAILIENTPRFGLRMRVPKPETALIADFERKVEAICRETVSQNVTSFAGVPSWNLVMLKKILEYTGKNNILEVWPNLELFAHGGMNFKPYREQYRRIIPSDRMKYIETYNASEGFFALADDPSRSDMLLMLDYGNFFEFRSGDTVVPLEGVECGKVYAMLITSNNGLWRYEIGDTVEFTSTNPYRIRFAGRTRQYINVFGEELIVDNADRALLAACNETGAVVGEYTVAPCYMSLRERGAHEWILEFEREPDSREHFAEALDRELRAVNSDYDAKRRTTLERQRLTVVGHGRFLAWMRARGKNKVPRLVNDRRVADEILAFGGEAK